MTEQIDFRIGYLKKRNRELSEKIIRLRGEISINNTKIWRLEKMKKKGVSNEI